EIIKFIKEKLDTKYKIQNTKVIYGGSVDGKNVADFVKYRDVDGVLVGSASLKLKEVVEIIKKVG
ncbi:triose-phosphate isomerase, partial [Candidatus Wolfebacteria bacterium]|nr:triose-phosphate isomerase [Candidatus Wolfebacteria bacterium]